MPEVVVPFGALLPPICVLTGREDREVAARVVTLRGRSAVTGEPVTHRLALPFHPEAWASLEAHRRTIAAAAAIAAVAFVTAVVGAQVVPWIIFGTWPLTAGAAAYALASWRDLRARSPRLVVLGKDGAAVDLPSGEAALKIAEHLEAAAAARRRMAALRRRLERLRSERRRAVTPAAVA